jgi:hypothetical protein
MGCGENKIFWKNTTINQTHHLIRELRDALDEEPHPFSESLWVDGTPWPADSGASRALSRVNLQKIERPKQMLWSALLGEEVALNKHVPQMDDDRHASPKELAEAAVLHLGRPDNPWRPVLDVTGCLKKYILVVDDDIVVVIVFFFIVFFFIVVVIDILFVVVVVVWNVEMRWRGENGGGVLIII